MSLELQAKNCSLLLTANYCFARFAIEEQKQLSLLIPAPENKEKCFVSVFSVNSKYNFINKVPLYFSRKFVVPNRAFST